ncbi:DUF1932 domain-containing protein [Actinomadura sp. ATCC 31491]|uniref:DUF1932 domain-containing protein n=1 Tax=Actinomadura luzonensis TaxID=2805427 RepID=A0ABT0G694_9ACTN|nr:NAD(P)-dependent oxidoreductase [Actinomadura luzonensis]MCK2220116.1 DUF1932 domain-containing protein [Actinomadura luzonensis]
MDGLRVALLGYGEVGRVLAGGLGGRVRLRAYDPAHPPASPLVAGNADAVRGADVVIAVTTGADSLAACAESRPHLKPGALYADLSTAAPGDKRAIAELAGSAGAVAVDGAIMAPVPLRGLATPILASGPGAERFAAFAGALGMDVTPIGGAPGDAAARKLLRSVLVKGLSALAVEARRAAEAAGLGEWFWAHLVETVTDADERFLTRLLEGAGQHGVRRVHEMRAATRMLEELGVPSDMTAATAAALHRATETGVPRPPGPR